MYVLCNWNSKFSVNRKQIREWVVQVCQIKHVSSSLHWIFACMNLLATQMMMSCSFQISYHISSNKRSWAWNFWEEGHLIYSWSKKSPPQKSHYFHLKIATWSFPILKSFSNNCYVHFNLCITVINHADRVEKIITGMCLKMAPKNAQFWVN